MKKLILIYLLVPCYLNAQKSTIQDTCAIKHETILWNHPFLPEDSVDVFSSVLDLVGREEFYNTNWPERFSVEARQVERFALASTSIFTSNRTIHYDSIRLSALQRVARTPWSLRFVAAHEFAHFSLGHLGKIKTVMSTFDEELEADKLAAIALAGMGLMDVELLTNTLNLISNNQQESDYPSLQDRLDAVREGWNLHFERQNISFMFAFQASKNRVYYNLSEKFWIADQNLSTTVLAIDKKLDSFKKSKKKTQKPHFLLDDGILKFVNEQANLNVFVGRVLESTNPHYHKMVIDDYYVFWFIDRENRIFDAKGIQLGRL